MAWHGMACVRVTVACMAAASTWLAVILTHEDVSAGQGLAFQDYVGLAVRAGSINGRALHSHADGLSSAANT